MHLAGSRYIEIYFIAILIHVLRHVSNSPGTQGPCCFGYNGKCVNNVTYNFGDKMTRGKREFIISCIDQQENQGREKPLDTDPQGFKKNYTQNANIFGTEEPEDGVGKGLGGGAISAIVIVVLVTLIGITAALVWKRRKIIGFIRKKVNKRPTKRTPDSSEDSQNKANEAGRFFEISVTCGRGTYGDHQDIEQ